MIYQKLKSQSIFKLAKTHTKNMIMTKQKESLRMPAEWETHRATWLSWPHNPETWPGKHKNIFKPYVEFISWLSKSETVCINVNDESMRTEAQSKLKSFDFKNKNIEFYLHPTNDCWVRDHGPIFLKKGNQTLISNWNFNMWGEKYPPWDKDNQIPYLISQTLSYERIDIPMVLEGGSIEVNGSGTLLTTKSCLLNPNRNPTLNQGEIEKKLSEILGIKKILWLGDGIVGDDTDGHIDDITRFVNKNTIVTVIEDNQSDENYDALKNNLKLLEKMTDNENQPFNIKTLPMPSPLYHKGQRLPASYANFYICNKFVIVPIFKDKNDEKALCILETCFKDRDVVGIDARDLVWGFGAFHCMSQQEPY